MQTSQLLADMADQVSQIFGKSRSKRPAATRSSRTLPATNH